jgi:hypothetical protein
MICKPWTEPVHTLLRSAPVSMIGLWSLLQTGAVAAAEFSLLPALDDDLRLTSACADLREAAGELEWAHPHLPASGVVLDIGPAPLDDVNGCRTAINALITAGLNTVIRLLEHPDVPVPDRFTLLRVLPLLSQAHTHVMATPT